MVRYQWTIKTTADGLLTGNADGTVYLSLHGLDAQMPELEIASKDLPIEGSFEKGGLATGVVEVEQDLGDLQTGRLRSDNRWHVDSVTVKDLGDGRQWTARVATWNDETGDFPLLRFAADEPAVDDIPPERSSPERPEPDEDLRTQLVELQRKYDALQRQCQRGGSGGQAAPTMETYELVAMKGLRLVPLDTVLFVGLSGGFELQPGTTLFVSKDPAEGFGLGGMPGRWADWYPDRSPADFGLAPTKGVLGWAVGRGGSAQGWAVSSDVLKDLLGPDWQNDLYG